jgi:D-serine deaminase-like pyridoxal phosphate-dependent protein
MVVERTGPSTAAARRTGVEPGMPVEEVPTPALLVDLDRMEANLARWQELATRAGKKLRPHIKTHKVPEIALRQLELGACGIAAAKPSEAEVFAEAGCRDIVLAYPVVGEDKWARMARIARTAKVAVNVDSELGARGLSAAAAAEGVTIHTHIEIDTGLNRVGFDPADIEGIVAFAHTLETLPGLELEGITTHRGKFGERLLAMTNEEAGRDEGELLVELAGTLRARGLPVAQVTAGGTVTGRGVAQVEGVTEVRAGTYVFNDAMQVAYGSARPEDLALSILATVVSTRRPGWATIDAGSKTCSGDRPGGGGAGTPVVAAAVDLDASVMRVTEEHGMVELGDGAVVEPGQKLRFTPFHVCTAVNLSDELVAVRNGVVERVWQILARGKRT